jgi:hypothetical protein
MGKLKDELIKQIEEEIEAAKKEDTGERVTLSDYLKQRKANNG